MSRQLPPSGTFLNQAAALIGWAAWLAALSAKLPRPQRPPAGLVALLAALGIMVLSALGSMAWAGLPATLGASAIGMVLAAALTAWVAAQLRAVGSDRHAFEAFCAALLAAGVVSALIGVMQVLVPDATGGGLIAAIGGGERAAGNLRQPNHLSSLLLWSMMAAVFLLRVGRLPAAFALPLYGLMLFYVGHRRLGRVFATEAELWLPRSNAARLPDICYLSNQHADRLTTRRLEGYADLVVEVVSAEFVVPARRFNFKEAVTQLEYGHVECPASQIVDENRLVFLFLQSVGQSCRRRLVDNAFDLKTGNFAGVFCRLPLAVIKVSRYRNDRLCHFFS